MDARPINSFELIRTHQKARRGRLHLKRGVIETPVFMPVGTRGTVKAMLPETLRELGVQIVLSNTYHLHLRPGDELIRALGGLHKFMNWSAPILTDSGGFQIFSLARLRKISEEGVTFRSHLDGTPIFMSPEKSMQIQKALGADIVMAFDECPPYPNSREAVEKACNQTFRWLERCVNEMKDAPGQLLFGIVQGGLDFELRMKSLEQITSFDLPGYALGGFSVGEPIELMHRLLPEVASQLPPGKPRYLMGVGTPMDLVLAVNSGIDMFDCVLPTRVARNGTIFTWNGKLSIKRKEYRADPRPFDEHCPCYTCRHYSRAYLRHMFLSDEILGSMLNSIHNIHFYMDLTKKMRAALEAGAWPELFQSCVTQFIKTDADLVAAKKSD